MLTKQIKFYLAKEVQFFYYHLADKRRTYKHDDDNNNDNDDFNQHILKNMMTVTQ